jgi:N-acetylmuramoyl-L-alanine amidase
LRGLAVLGLLALSGCGASRQPTGTTTIAFSTTPVAASTTTAATTTTTTTTGSRTPRPHRRRPRPQAVIATAVPKPQIVWDPIPFGPQRKAEMVAYAQRHYGMSTYRLADPRVIVIHYTETPDFQSTYNTFARDTPDSELHELPNTCAHFVIDADGVIHQLVLLDIMCRHTVGLNWTAIGIEHVGYSDQQVLGDARQIASSLALVRWLRCRYGIPVTDVIGHNESLSSRYHHEDVPALRTQTHGDFVHADMDVYRARLRAQGGCV